MSVRKFTNWFVTDAGKTFSYFAAGTICTSVAVGTFLPHTIFLEKYQDIIRLYEKGLVVPISKQLNDRFEKALDLVKVLDPERALFKPFHVVGLDMYSAGTWYSKYGVAVGFPINFTYNSINDVDKSKFKVGPIQQSISWGSAEGQQLLTSLILSEDAQIYAMAKEIKMRQTLKPLIDWFIAGSSCLLAYGISNHVNEKYNYYAKPVGFRLILYTFVGLFCFGTYIAIKDGSQLYYEREIDKELARENPMFIKAGQEYYTKILERNKALRKLMGPEGEKCYSVLGNENYFLRTKHVPLVDRKAFFDEFSKNQLNV